MYYKSKQDTIPTKDGLYLWRPEFVRTGQIVDVRKIAKFIAGATTLTVPDIVAVLLALPEYMNLFMREGHTVRLDGLGTFYLYGCSSGNGVETREEVNASQFNRIICRFNPEYTVNTDGTRTRALGGDLELVNIERIAKHASVNKDDGGDDGWQDPNA